MGRRPAVWIVGLNEKGRDVHSAAPPKEGFTEMLYTKGQGNIPM